MVDIAGVAEIASAWRGPNGVTAKPRSHGYPQIRARCLSECNWIHANRY
jgi:hypothetical protein